MDNSFIVIAGEPGSYTARCGNGTIEHPHRKLAEGDTIGAVLYHLTREEGED